MKQVSRSVLRERAEDCVFSMGDIFWDAHVYEAPDPAVKSPYEIAIDAVVDAFADLVGQTGFGVLEDT